MSSLAVVKEEETINFGEKYWHMFNNICNALTNNGVKHTAYKEEFYICIDMKKNTEEKLIGIIENEIKFIFRDEKPTNKYRLKTKLKKATLFFKTEIKR